MTTTRSAAETGRDLSTSLPKGMLFFNLSSRRRTLFRISGLVKALIAEIAEDLFIVKRRSGLLCVLCGALLSARLAASA
jgi:hypothetical protein